MKKRKRLSERISDLLEIPGDVITDTERIVIVGNRNVNIEGFRGIDEYSDEKIAVRIKGGVFSVSGEELTVEEITDERIRLKGYIKSVEFM